MYTLDTIKCLEEQLVCLLEDEFDQGLDKADTQEVGMVVDMVKDLAEAKEKCIKACYYERMMGDSIESEPHHHHKESAHNPHSKEPSWAKGEDYYEEFQEARDHFGKSGAAADKAKMDEKAKEHVKAFIDSVQDIWADADPQMRKQLKSDLTRMVNDLT